ncbi:MAG: TOBE domain-containing protein [Ilumatobacteraceae bacterium]
MGDRVAVLKDGELQQCASPRELFTRPANQFVAAFIGSPAMNMFACTLGPDGAEYASLTIPVTPAQRSALTTDEVTVGVRPEALHLSADGLGMKATIDTVEELGSDSYLYCTPHDHPDVSVVSRAEGLSTARPGDTVVLEPATGSLHLFDAATGARLPD